MAVEIKRDQWGIPRIEADSDADACHALGITQVQDRPEQLFQNLLGSEGRLAEFFGERFFEDDLRSRRWRFADSAQAELAGLAPSLRSLLEAFADGINTGAQTLGDRRPAYAFDVQPWHPLCLWHSFGWHWIYRDAIRKLRAAGFAEHMRQPRASNQWAVAPWRTADGAPLLLIDPHLSWNGPGRMIEVAMRADRLYVNGFALTGTPLILLGHTRSVAWSCTSGGPDCSDVYRVRCTDESLTTYRVADRTLNVEVEQITVPVRTNNTCEDRTCEVRKTSHGHVFCTDGLDLYAVRSAYDDVGSGFAEQVWRMNTADSVEELRRALNMNLFVPQNIMYAGTDGTIGYRRCGRVPIRPERVDCTAPLDGNSAAFGWTGIHAPSELCQVENPACGWMQNCNVSPAAMFPGSTFVPGAYPSYVVNDPHGRENNRSRRASDLLAANDRMSIDDALRIALDVGVDWVEAPDEGLLSRTEFFERCLRNPQTPDQRRAAELLNAWDGQMSTDSTGATLAATWVWHIQQARSAGRQFDPMVALDNACGYLRETFGTIEVPWGQTHRIGAPTRPDHHFPAPGASENGFVSVWPVGASEPDAHGIRRATRGSVGMMLVSLTDPVRSWSLQPYGQSDDPSSPHVDDQAERLVSKRAMKRQA